MRQVVHSTRQTRCLGLASAHVDGSRKILLQLLLILLVRLAVVVRQEGEFMPAPQLARGIEGTNVAAAMNRHQLIGLDPEDSQILSPLTEPTPLCAQSQML